MPVNRSRGRSRKRFLESVKNDPRTRYLIIDDNLLNVARRMETKLIAASFYFYFSVCFRYNCRLLPEVLQSISYNFVVIFVLLAKLFYRQINGIFKGNSMRRILVQIVTDYIIDTVITNLKKRRLVPPCLWVNYVNDHLVLRREEIIQTILYLLNAFHPLIKFTRIQLIILTLPSISKMASSFLIGTRGRYRLKEF